MTITTAEYHELMATWRKGNDNGVGFYVGDLHDTITNAILREGDTVEGEYPTDQSLAIGKRPDGTRYIVCNSNGPWAVALIA